MGEETGGLGQHEKSRPDAEQCSRPADERRRRARSDLRQLPEMPAQEQRQHDRAVKHGEREKNQKPKTPVEFHRESRTADAARRHAQQKRRETAGQSGHGADRPVPEGQQCERENEPARGLVREEDPAADTEPCPRIHFYSLNLPVQLTTIHCNIPVRAVFCKPEPGILTCFSL